MSLVSGSGVVGRARVGSGIASNLAARQTNRGDVLGFPAYVWPWPAERPRQHDR